MNKLYIFCREVYSAKFETFFWNHSRCVKCHNQHGLSLKNFDGEDCIGFSSKNDNDNFEHYKETESFHEDEENKPEYVKIPYFVVHTEEEDESSALLTTNLLNTTSKKDVALTYHVYKYPSYNPSTWLIPGIILKNQKGWQTLRNMMFHQISVEVSFLILKTTRELPTQVKIFVKLKLSMLKTTGTCWEKSVTNSMDLVQEGRACVK